MKTIMPPKPASISRFKGSVKFQLFKLVGNGGVALAYIVCYLDLQLTKFSAQTDAGVHYYNTEQ